MQRYSYPHVRDDVVLEVIVVECFEQHALSGAILQASHKFSQQCVTLVGKVLIEHLVIAGGSASVSEGAKPGFLFEELVRISTMDQSLEVAERDSCVQSVTVSQR